MKKFWNLVLVVLILSSPFSLGLRVEAKDVAVLKYIADNNADEKLSTNEITHMLLRLGSSKNPKYDIDLNGTVDAKDLEIFEKAIADEKMAASAHKLLYLVDRNANRRIEAVEIVDIALGMFDDKDAALDPEYDINSDLVLDSKDYMMITSFARSFDTAYNTSLRAISAVDVDGDMVISIEEADAITAVIETAYESNHISVLAKYDLNYDESFDATDDYVLSYVVKQAKYKA